MSTSHPSAATLVLDFLAASADRKMSAQALCCAGAIMGFSEATIRVALTRLAQQKKIVKLERASYALDTRRNRLQFDVENWRERVDWIAPWRGDWIIVADGMVDRVDKTGLRRHHRALLLRGFQKWKPGLHVRPNNLVGGAQALRQQLPQLGLANGAELFVARDFDAKQSAALSGLWNASALRRGREKTLARAETSRRRLARMDTAAAARETLLVGRELIGAVLHDPLLPPELAPGVGIQKLAQAISDYQSLSRQIWDRALAQA